MDWSDFSGELRHGWDWVLGRFRRRSDVSTVRNRLLVVMGAADPHRLTTPLAYALATALPDLPLTIAFGPAVDRGNIPADLLNSLGSQVSVYHDCRDLLPLLASPGGRYSL